MLLLFLNRNNPQGDNIIVANKYIQLIHCSLSHHDLLSWHDRVYVEKIGLRSDAKWKIIKILSYTFIKLIINHFILSVFLLSSTNKLFTERLTN